MSGSMGDDDDDNAMPPPPAAAYAPCLDPVAAVRAYQAWRRGANMPSPHPTALGEAIDTVLARLETLAADRGVLLEAVEKHAAGRLSFPSLLRIAAGVRAAIAAESATIPPTPNPTKTP